MLPKFNPAVCLFVFLFSACNGTTPSAAVETPKQIMDGWVGTWQVELQLKKSLLTPEAMTVRGTETIRWTLNKQFLQSEQSYAEGAYKKLVLTRYDANEGVFLFWDFDSNGSFPMGVTRGRWDAKKREIVIRGEYFGGTTAKGMIRWSDQDHAEMNLRVMSADGAVLLDVNAKSDRSK